MAAMTKSEAREGTMFSMPENNERPSKRQRDALSKTFDNGDEKADKRPVQTGWRTNTPCRISEALVAKIQQLAYAKAEQRGFEPGHELEDWLDAEREVCGRLFNR